MLTLIHVAADGTFPKFLIRADSIKRVWPADEMGRARGIGCTVLTDDGREIDVEERIPVIKHWIRTAGREG